MAQIWRTYYSPENYAISSVYQIAEDHFGNEWLGDRRRIIEV
jgi:hypothetical protein